MNLIHLQRRHPSLIARNHGLVLLRAKAEALGLNLAEFITMERRHKLRAFIELKILVGKRMSSTSDIDELRAFSKLYDNICAIQSKKLNYLGTFGGDFAYQ